MTRSLERLRRCCLDCCGERKKCLACLASSTQRRCSRACLPVPMSLQDFSEKGMPETCPTAPCLRWCSVLSCSPNENSRRSSGRLFWNMLCSRCTRSKGKHPLEGDGRETPWAGEKLLTASVSPMYYVFHQLHSILQYALPASIARRCCCRCCSSAMAQNETAKRTETCTSAGTNLASHSLPTTHDLVKAKNNIFPIIELLSVQVVYLITRKCTMGAQWRAKGGTPEILCTEE